VRRAYKAWKSGSFVPLSLPFSHEDVRKDVLKFRRTHVAKLLEKDHRCTQLLKKVEAERKATNLRASASAGGAGAGGPSIDSDEDEKPIADRSSPPAVSIASDDDE
jgi:hypothetical protein